MKLEVGDLVQYRQGPERLGIVLMTHITTTGAAVCEVVIIYDGSYPETVGEKRYANQDYWEKVENPARPLDVAIEDCVDEYEEAVDLHKTYGES